MTDLVNPLNELGLPSWLIQASVEDGPEALDRLRRHIGHIVRVASRTYHPDVFPVDPRGIYNRLVRAGDALTTVEEIEAWASFLLHPDTVSHTEHERLRELAAKRESARWRALLDMLHVVDQFQVGNVDRPSELIFGLPVLNYQVQLTYDATYLLRLSSTRSAELIQASPGRDLIITLGNRHTWDEAQGAWAVKYLIDDDGSDDPQDLTYATHYHHKLSDATQVQLVGAVPSELIPELYERAHPMADESRPALTMGDGYRIKESGPTQLSQIFWLPPDRVWWMEALTPRLEVGGYGVIMRPTTGELALVGQLLAKRTL